MNTSHWASAPTAAAAAEAASTTVADAMLALPWGRARRGRGAEGGRHRPARPDEGRAAGAAPPGRSARFPGIGGIAETGDGELRIGTLATLEQIAAHKLIAERYTALAEAAGGSASPQIRHVATIGGNLLQRPHCWYFRSLAHRCLRKGGGKCFAVHGENQYHAIFANEVCAVVHPSTAATALVALGARIEILNADGEVRRPLLEEFFVVPDTDVQRENDLRAGEMVSAVLLPGPEAGATSAHGREADKQAFDWPIADVAVMLERDPDGRCRRALVVLGAAAPVPYRARAAEDMLTGGMIDPERARAAGQATLKGSMPLAKNQYKQPVFAALVARVLLRAAGQG